MTRREALPSRLRNFVFTLNTPTVDGPTFLDTLVTRLPISYLAFQLERGEEEGRLHFQGYVELSKQVGKSAVLFAFDNRAHIENRKGSAQEAQQYATKEDTRVDGPWIHGNLSGQGRRSDLAGAIQLLADKGFHAVAQELPSVFVRNSRGLRELDMQLHKYDRREPPQVTLYVGPTGVGKTHIPWSQEPNLVAFGGGLQWFCNYCSEEAVLFDEFDGALSKTPLKWLLQLLDRYPLLLPTKGGHVLARYKRVYITSNFHPSKWFDYAGRWEHYHALARRITRVQHWNSDQRDDFTIYEPGTPEWDAYWKPL